MPLFKSLVNGLKFLVRQSIKINYKKNILYFGFSKLIKTNQLCFDNFKISIILG